MFHTTIKSIPALTLFYVGKVVCMAKFRHKYIYIFLISDNKIDVHEHTSWILKYYLS